MSKTMTDNEIKKALECCAERIICLVPYEDNGTQFYQLSVGYILDLINRLEAENERLKQNNKAIMQTVADVHTEAIKEFAERLKERAYLDSGITGFRDLVVDAIDIDNLLNELVGE